MSGMSNKASGRARPAGAAVLDADVTDAIVVALMDEMSEKGYVGMSMDGLARRAGVGKGAIYRRWPSKEHMTVEVLRQISNTDADIADRGSLREDLRAALEEVREWLGSAKMGSIYPDILAEGMRSPAMAQLLTEAIEGPRRRRGMTILDRALQRGELAPAVDTELFLDLMGALVFWRLVARRGVVTDAHLESIVDLLMAQAQRPAA